MPRSAQPRRWHLLRRACTAPRLDVRGPRGTLWHMLFRSVLLRALPRRFLAVAVLLSSTVGCSHSDGHGTTPRTATAELVAGPQDSHCGTKVVSVDPTTCKATADGGAGASPSEYGATLANGEADDDDCKYRVKWSAAAAAAVTTKTLSLSPLHGNEAAPEGDGADVMFTVTVTTKKDGLPVTGAPIGIEAFLDDTHPALNAPQSSKETAPGTYTVGPVRFDVSGKWTLRFHIHDECNDSEQSPHGHVAFFAQVTVK